MSDAWSPEQYHRFRDQRSAPFQDLLALIRPISGGRAVDLGCGSGELTSLMADRTCASDVVGIDSSAAMLAEATAQERPGLHFSGGDLAAWGGDDGPVDLVVANASLQWVPDHAGVLRRWTDALAPRANLPCRCRRTPTMQPIESPSPSRRRAVSLDVPRSSAR